MQRSNAVLGVVFVVLAAAVLVLWTTLLRETSGTLRVSFLDIGQGDAIFVQAPGGRQVLIDGGPADGGILRRLGEVLPWYDRSIDVVIPTHPDADHIAGLLPVLRRYDVSYIVHSDVAGDTVTARRLVSAMRHEGARDVVARRGQVIELGGSARLEVLAPDRSVTGVATNDGCVVTRLVYGNTAFMLGCDAPQTVDKYLAALDGRGLKSDVLKAGHHGSRTSSAPLFLDMVDPQWVVYSRGCDNIYGHPNRETIETMARFGIPTLDTCEQGTITFESDGRKVWRE
jgi:competence protein ComEC